MDRVKKRKQTIWTLVTVVFLVIAFIVGIIAQSNQRTKERNEVLSAVYETQVNGYDYQKLANAIIEKNAQIKKAVQEKPLLNIQLRSIPADASLPSKDSFDSQQEWCQVLQDIYKNSEEISLAEGFPAGELADGAAGLIAISNCNAS